MQTEYIWAFLFVVAFIQFKSFRKIILIIFLIGLFTSDDDNDDDCDDGLNIYDDDDCLY